MNKELLHLKGKRENISDLTFKAKAGVKSFYS